jgi:hypothetical protein
MSGGETIRLEEYTGLIQNRLVAVWQTPEATAPWLPSEFLLSQYITRILIAGRSAAVSAALTADQSWTQVWRTPGNKEWACLLSVLQHMPGPILVVLGPDVPLTPKLVGSLQGARASSPTTVIVVRQPAMAAWVGEPADQVFFPVIEGVTTRTTGLITVIQEWMGRTAPRTLDIKTLLPQLSAQGYALTASDGHWHWYKPADSPPLASLTVPQVARQLQVLSVILEKAAI